jgi:hypothetical protein
MKKIFLVLVSFYLISGCSTLNHKQPKKNDENELKIIDAHVHTYLEGTPINKILGDPQKEELFFKELDEAHVVGAVAHTFESGKYFYKNLKNKNIIHCLGLAEDTSYSEAEASIKSGKFSCMKVYLGYIYKYATDKTYKPFYKLAEKYDIPVVFHTGDTVTKDGKIKYSDPMAIDEVAVDNPKVKFIIAHCGNPWIQTAAEIAYKNENVYLEGSAFLAGNIDEMSEDKIQKSVIEPIQWIFNYIENPQKLMFGSDWPLVNIASYVRVFKKAIPKEHWNDVFYNNAKRVFKKLK